MLFQNFHLVQNFNPLFLTVSVIIERNKEKQTAMNDDSLNQKLHPLIFLHFFNCLIPFPSERTTDYLISPSMGVTAHLRLSLSNFSTIFPGVQYLL